MISPRRRKDDCEHRRAKENGLRKYAPEFDPKVNIGGLINFIILIVASLSGLFLYFVEWRDFKRDTTREIAAIVETANTMRKTQDRVAETLSDIKGALLVKNAEDVEIKRRLDRVESKRSEVQ